MYFNALPLIYYSLDNANQSIQIARDVTIRTKIAEAIKDATVLYDRYIIKDGERPDQVAAKFYSNSELHWIIMIANDIIDPYHDWPMSEAEVYQFAAEKYTNPSGIHHYENSKGQWVMPNTFGAVAIRNLEYEIAENDKKRVIKMVRPAIALKIVEEYFELVKR